MAKIKISSSITQLEEEISHTMLICTHINQMVSKLRTNYLSNISLSINNIQSYYTLLLSMTEHIEGSTTLLELLLATEQRNVVLFQKQESKRKSYTRDELLQLRDLVTSELSNEVAASLKKVVERESNNSVEIERKSWRDIRTILM